MTHFKILDCTLRDGGYYTDWSFDEGLVRRMVKALDENEVDIIELGYKSPIIGGPFRKCNDGFISSLIDFNVKASLAFMIDVKDYLYNDKINTNLLLDIIKPAKNSPFKVCRIAAKSDEIKHLPELIETIGTDLGYEVICNLMGMSTLKDNDVDNFNTVCTNHKVTAAYLADSYGAVFPFSIQSFFSRINHTKGLHTHDNLGLAFANCIAALGHGAEYIDGTVLGMGRGVGNVKTEQLLMFRNRKVTNLLIDVINEFEVLKKQYNWGYSIVYMHAGMNHVHPLYAQDINGYGLNSKVLLSTLDGLSNTLKYNKEHSKTLYQVKTSVIIPARFKSSRFPGKPLAMIQGKPMVIHVAEKAAEAVGIDNVYVATENFEITEVVKQYGFKVILTSDNCLTGTDRVAEAAKEIDSDIIINVQGDEPMIDPNDITRVIELKKQYPNHVINCMSKLHPDEDPNDKKIPKIVCNLNNDLLYSSRSMIPGTKTNIADNIYKQVCIYAFNKNELGKFYSNKKTPLENYEDIEIVRCLEKGIPVKMMEVEKISYAVDYPEDINIIENKLK